MTYTSPLTKGSTLPSPSICGVEQGRMIVVYTYLLQLLVFLRLGRGIHFEGGMGGVREKERD